MPYTLPPIVYIIVLDVVEFILVCEENLKKYRVYTLDTELKNYNALLNHKC